MMVNVYCIENTSGCYVLFSLRFAFTQFKIKKAKKNISSKAKPTFNDSFSVDILSGRAFSLSNLDISLEPTTWKPCTVETTA